MACADGCAPYENATEPLSPPVDHTPAAIEKSPHDASLKGLREASPERELQHQFDLATATYQGLFTGWFPEDWPRRHVRGLSRKRTIALAAHRFERSSSVWQGDELACLMHGHLGCLVASAWHKSPSDGGPERKMKMLPRRPPPPPLTMLDLVVDSFPTTYDGLRAFYLLCEQRPATVLRAVQRRLRWLMHHGHDACQVPFEEQAEQIIGAFFRAE
jgi:hypothetical protein